MPRRSFWISFFLVHCCEELELWQIDLDRPFRLSTDASDYAIGAELRQEIQGQWRPVALYSRKLGHSQLNWTAREKETYAVVMALRKWGGYIGYQPVEVYTDSRSLEHWVTENVDTPSGPRGRRARWHEVFSLYDLHVTYVPGPQNVVADAMSRWAYPASSAREDVSLHGSARAQEEALALDAEAQRDAESQGLDWVEDPPGGGSPPGQSRHTQWAACGRRRGGRGGG